MSSLLSISERFAKSQVMPWESDRGGLEGFIGNSTPLWGYDQYTASQEERSLRIAGEQAADAAAAQAVIDKKAATAAQAAQAAADKIAADKAKADKEAKDAAAALAARRRGSSPIATSAQGLLGSAPVQYKMLLGQ